MSTTDEGTASDSDTVAAPDAPPHEGEDWFLQTIVAYANVGFEIGLTLMVGGLTVSGVLISGKKYFEELGESVRAAKSQSPEMMNTLAETWSSFSRIYEKPEGASDDWLLPPASYIHLRSAYVFAPGAGHLPTGKGTLWRGRVAAVDGFAIGNLTVS
jgi:hypothetical protein